MHISADDIITVIAYLALLILLLTPIIAHALPARTFLRAHRLQPKEGWWLLAFSALEVPINTLPGAIGYVGLFVVNEGFGMNDVWWLAWASVPLLIALCILLWGYKKHRIKLAMTTALPRILSALVSIGLGIAFIIDMRHSEFLIGSIIFVSITCLFTIFSAIRLWKEDIANRKWTRFPTADKLK